MLQRDDQWLSHALHILQHMQTAYISLKKPPPEDALAHDAPELHSKFLQTTVTAMQRIQRQQHADVPSSINRDTMAPIFLDDAADGDARKATVGT